MTKFNAKQRNFIENAWNHGFSDRIIAKKLSVPYLVIYTYRRSLGLSVITVSENRYDTWIQLIEKGVSLEAIAEQYEVNPYSIKIMLWRKRSYSFREINKRILDEAKSKKAAIEDAKLETKAPFSW